MGGGGNKKKTLGLDMCVSLFRASRSVPPRTSPEPIYRTGSESVSSPSLSLYRRQRRSPDRNRGDRSVKCKRPHVERRRVKPSAAAPTSAFSRWHRALRDGTSTWRSFWWGTVVESPLDPSAHVDEIYQERESNIGSFKIEVRTRCTRDK